MKSALGLTSLLSALVLLPSAFAFEGRIQATVTRGGQACGLLYIVGTNQLRIEKTDTNWPHARNIVDLQTGALTLLFPHNRSFVRLKPESGGPHAPPRVTADAPFAGLVREARPTAPGAGALPTPPAIGPTNLPGVPAPPPMPSMPAMPAEMRMPPAGLPPGVGPQPGATPGITAGPGTAPGMPPGIGPQTGTMPGMGAGPGMPPGMSAMPAMPAMPPMPMMPGMMEKAELKATGQKTNLLGCACERFELKQRHEILEVWATDQLLPFEAYQQNQPHPGGPRMIEEEWPEMMKARRLFPLLVTLRFENVPERYRFEVNSLQPTKLADPALFQPPPDYQEIEPLPF